MGGDYTNFATLAVHAGQEPVLALGNPTRANFEKAVAALEGAKYGLAFASGSVTTATVASLAGNGSHIVSVNDVYGGTFRYFTKVASTYGVETTFCDLRTPDNIRSAIKPNTKLVWIETPTNPTLRLVDIRAVAEIAHTHPGVLVVVDNTFMSPFFQRPLELGADIVVHSVTKYLNGHSDVVMGVAVTSNDAVYERLKFLQNSIGGIPSPFDCFLANRGLKTLHIRMKRHEENALAIAAHLEASPLVGEVIYPGLKSHPQHELAVRQQHGFGGMVSFRIKNGDLKASNTFLGSLTLFALAESLGGIESLAELPVIMTHASVAPELRAELGITESLIRLSCGIEDVKDLIADIDQALKKAHAVL
ncbi:Cys/Met metabolism PLP-dependent enzyme-domain-containing protein [Entophlyctis helioformis]|nr:Cys/Met metabolism PLP-dependent enzyme-domain-containing protein [Entophlyctis helioformis]